MINIRDAVSYTVRIHIRYSGERKYHKIDRYMCINSAKRFINKSIGNLVWVSVKRCVRSFNPIALSYEKY